MILTKPPKKKTETDLVREILGALNRMDGVRAVRNNTGKLQDKNGRWVTYGLGVGGPDIVGVFTGLTFNFPIAFGVEVKRPGKARSPAQVSWAKGAKRLGVSVCVATTTDEAILFVMEARLRVELT